MKKTEAFISELGWQKSPLGSGIQPEETNELIEGLRIRLGVSQKELDLSPASLKKLENLLINYKQNLIQEGRPLEGDELALFIRQTAAYLGEVLVTNLNGSWTKSVHLFSTDIKINDDKIIEKEGVKFLSNSIGIVVGWEAAFAWDTIEEGKKPNLYNIYKGAKSKHLKENL